MKFLSGIKDYFNRSPNIVKHLDPDNNKFRLFLFFTENTVPIDFRQWVFV